jgi:hypothetical protein
VFFPASGGGGQDRPHNGERRSLKVTVQLLYVTEKVSACAFGEDHLLCWGTENAAVVGRADEEEASVHA